METEDLDQAETCLFKGNFYDKEKRKVGVVLPPDSFFKLHNTEECKRVFGKVDLEGYCRVPPWGVDVQISYELMASIDEDVNAKITGKEREKLQVKITEDILNEALKLLPSSQTHKLPYQLIDQERKITFSTPQGKKETFKDLVNPKLILPLRLYAQHFAMGKPQKYTHPNKRVAGFMAKAMVTGLKQNGDFGKNIFIELVGYKRSKGLQEKPHLANGQRKEFHHFTTRCKKERSIIPQG